jgi:putative flippase GtrA
LSGRTPRNLVSRPLLFGVVGVANTAVDFAVYLLLTRVFSVDPVMAHVLGYWVGMLHGYVASGLLTFRDSGVRLLDLRTQLRFALAIILSFSASVTGMVLLVRLVPDIGAKVLCTVFTTILNYVLSSRFVYRGGA